MAAQPPPLTNPAVCASADGGSWLVGLNQDKFAIYKFSSGEAQAKQVPIKGTVAQASIKDFNGGQCFESGKRLFFVSDNPNGYIDTTTNTWSYLTGELKYFENLTKPNQIALDVGPITSNGEGVTIYSIASNQLWRWNSTTLKPTAVTVPARAVPSWNEVTGMASSNNNAHLWAMFTNTSGTFATELTFGAGPTPDTRTFGLPQNTNHLIPMASGSGVASVVPVQGAGGIAAITIWKHNLPPTLKNITAASNSLFVVDDNTVSIIDPDAMTSSTSGAPVGKGQPASPNVPPPGPGDPTGSQSAPSTNSKSNIGVIIGSTAGVLAVVVIALFFLMQRRKKRRGGRAKHLFPASKQDDTLVPLGIYHQNRDGPPETLNRLQHDLANLGYDPRPNDQFAQSRFMAQPGYPSRAPDMSNDSRSSIQNQFDETIPVEAMLTHHQHERHTPQGLTHSISVSSTTSKFARRNAKTGKRFEEKIQLQVIQYEVDDARTISPHGYVGRLVLGTYHVISPARPARSVKAQGPGIHQGVARSGTVLVRRSRLDFSSSGGGTRSPSPSLDAHAESSMLLTDVENQHTFETATLKWYMTEMHWKREAALLKHLKSPIFVVELLESYCIPALQVQANAYPFVNAMGGCNSLLSDLGPVRTSQHARAILRSISGAVDWCHRHGVVHLNLQPGSFFLEDGIDPKTEDASWKLWDFTCARFIGEAIGAVGGGGVDEDQQQQQQQQLRPEAYPFLEQGHRQHDMDRIGGNPLPAAYTAPELLEAWRAGDTTFPVEAGMDTWSLGCVYYEVLAGQPLFHNEAEAWALVGGWSGKERWTSKDFRVPYPPPSSTPTSSSSSPTPITAATASTSMTMVQDMSSPLAKSQILDPSGSIAQLLQGMLRVNADERITLETIMEKIY
ncbi:hypothetical protein BGZ93_010671 [Podila epicladia]|nr:hypothetical protein BGZ92_003920 [Podila epicladia]KAG0098708.1 hypothetical protein BGZ93_010671 [Podila epicladia]